MKIGDIELKWLGHSGVFIKSLGIPGSSEKTIYIDPYMIADNSEKADIILITHSHYDHCSIADMQKIVKNGTKVFVPADAQSKITRFNFDIEINIMEPGKEVSFGNIKVNAVPSYNIDKSFHPKEEQWLGYVVKIGNTIIYHAGDTDNIPEMQKLTGYNQPNSIFIAFLPIGGRFTMTAEEAAGAAVLIKPSLAIPMHYGTLIGSKEDAEEFVKLCREKNINAQIIEKS